MKSSDSERQATLQPPIGIDLGTTYSLLAYLDETGRPVSFRNPLGELLTPSAVIVDEEEIVVGREAVKASAFAPENYAECFKRDMGRAVAQRPVRGLAVPPEVLSAFVLERLKHDAQQRLGPLEKAVITVPAYFDEICRKATQDAGRLAGWEVIDIINEPTAAALCCGFERGLFGLKGKPPSDTPERVLVYDLGGGTFDVTLLEIDGKTFRTIGTDGDVRLGGKDFDKCLLDHVAEKFQSVHRRDPRSDDRDLAQLWRDAQDLKHALTEHKKASVVCFHDGVRMRVDVTRDEFEGLTRHLLQRTNDTANLVIERAGFQWPEIHRVLLVGGATRMPMIGEMLQRLTGKEPDRSMSADEAVAHGAALYAGMLMEEGPESLRSCELINVNSHSLGVVGINEQIRQRVNAILIPRNTPIPARVTKVFRTFGDDQRSVVVPVVEGESQQPEYCVALGKCVVRNLPPGLPKGTLIAVSYRYANNGRLSVTARVPSAGQSAEVEFQRGREQVDGDLDDWRQRLLKSDDRALAAPRTGDREGQPSDRGTIYNRLDELYTRIGRLAIKRDVPEMCEASRRAAQSAADDLSQARRMLAEIQQRQEHSAAGASGPEVAQARLAERQAAINSGFAFLVLGREVVRAGFCPVGAEADLEEARSLRDRLQ
jgi:molecular chaperone DnaK